jgi:hypothetical protein
MLVMEVEDGGSETEGEGKSQRRGGGGKIGRGKIGHSEIGGGKIRLGEPRSAKIKRAEGQPAANPGRVWHTEAQQRTAAWSHVNGRMAQAQVYWITTVDPSGRPHATPVDGLWLDDRLYFGEPGGAAQPQPAEPGGVVHLESGSDVVILYGKVDELGGEDHELAQLMADASNEKYGYGTKAEDYLAGGTFAFTPQKVIAWKTLFKDATRWEF